MVFERLYPPLANTSEVEDRPTGRQAAGRECPPQRIRRGESDDTMSILSAKYMNMKKDNGIS